MKFADFVPGKVNLKLNLDELNMNESFNLREQALSENCF